MNLHRIEGRPEWANIPAAKRNGWQRLAAASGGVITVGNFFSLLGLASVPVGIWLILHGHQYLPGAVVLAAGRMGDLLDGWTADKTGTKSPFGELIDAMFDKISIILTVAGLLLATIIPWWALTIWLAPHAVTSVFALIAWLQNKRLHPGVEGKIGTATGWISMLLFVTAAAFTGPHPHADLRALIIGGALALLAITAVLSLMATVSYIRDFFKK